MYESVDDEVSDRFSVDSLECSCPETTPEPLKPPDNNPVTSSIPFRLHEEKHTEESTSKGEKVKLLWNCEIDESVLMSKGLQLNKDGSFSKSPRDGKCENLPFIMPAPRVALIRQKKQEMKKNSQEGLGKVEGLKRTERRGGNYGELSRLKASGNLTDSMKEVLYKKLIGGRKEPEMNAVESLLAKFKKDLSLEGKQKSEEYVRSSKAAKKNRSDLQLPMIEKPVKLSYFERYQKKNGFDPKSMTLKGQKTVEDTVRSKFGDSSRDALSDVSARCTVVDDDDDDEDEEVFYRKIMAEDDFSVRNCGSDNSERSLGESRREKSVERKKEVRIAKIKGVKKKCKAPSNTLGNMSSGRKSGHSCATDHQEPIPKAELASKARAYGNLANTRNIVKMQLKSYRRDWECPGVSGLGESFLPPVKDARFSPSGRRGIL